MRENAWKTYDSETMKKVFELSEGYKKFISDCKTERALQWQKQKDIVI